MQPYAIVQVCGRQFFIEENNFYDFNKLPVNRGDSLSFQQILLVNDVCSANNDLCEIYFGRPYLNYIYKIEGLVLRHISSTKTKIYKMRAKKKTRKRFGYRLKLTRVLIKSVLKQR